MEKEIPDGGPAYQTMKNLIIGSEGFVGTRLCLYLEALGEEVFKFDSKRGLNEDARYNSLPLSGIDRVYFLAWDVGGSKYLYEKNTQLNQINDNCLLLSNVMRQIHQFGTPFVFVSTQLAEKSNMAYGVTKKLGELWTEAQSGLCLRLWNVYGPVKEPGLRSHVIEDLVFQAVKNKKINLLTNGEETRQFIHVDDVCRAFHLGLESGKKGLYDVSTYEWTKVKDVAEIIANITGSEIVVGNEKGVDFPTTTVGILPNWEHKISLKDGIERLVRDVKSFYNLSL